MPTDYSFGVTAASAETPDSFEAYKFQLSTAQSISREEPRREKSHTAQTQEDSPASKYQSSDSQFEDLHNRLQSIQAFIESLNKEISNIKGDAENRHREVTRGLLSRDTLNEISSQGQKLDRIEKTMNSFQERFSNLQNAMKDSHISLTEGLPQHVSNSKRPTDTSQSQLPILSSS